MAIRRCNILDLWELLKLMEELEPEKLITLQKLRDILVDTNSYIFVSERHSICLAIERLTQQTGKLHIYAKEEARGKAVLDFVQECREEVEKTDIRFLFNYVKDRKLKLLMGYFSKTRRIGDYQGHTVYKTEV